MKTSIKLVVGVAALAALVAAVLFFLLSRIPAAATAVDEDPAGEESADPQRRADRALVDTIAGLLGIDADSADTTYRLLQEVVARGEVEIAADELADIVTTAMSSGRDGRIFLEAAAGPIMVRYQDERAEIGAVVDLRKLRDEALSDDARESVEAIRRYASFLTSRPIWVALDAVPVARGGDVDLGDDVALEIGSLRLPAFVARALGFDARLREALLLDLRFLTVDSVEVHEDRLHLRAKPSLGGR